MVDGRSGADLVQCLLTVLPDVPPPPAAGVHARPAPTLVGLVGNLVTWLVGPAVAGYRADGALASGPPRSSTPGRPGPIRIGRGAPAGPAAVDPERTLGSRRIWGWADPAARLHMVAARTAEQKSGEVAEATVAVVRMADHTSLRCCSPGVLARSDDRARDG